MQLASIAESVGVSVVGLRRGARRGSGVVVARDRVAVLFHSLREDRVEVVFADGRSEDAELAGVDRRHGVAVLQVATDGAPAVRWSAAQPTIGDSVFALANPGAGGLRATEGRVSAAPISVRGRQGRSIDGMIEHTAPLPRGAGGGPLVDSDGAVLGTHEGVHGFTIGQRKGLGIAGPGPDGQPRYVTGIDAETGVVQVGSAADLEVHSLTGEAPIFTSGVPFDGPVECVIQVRAHGGLADAVAELRDGALHVDLRTPLRGVAPGQTMVLYRPDADGDEVVASATIVH